MQMHKFIYVLHLKTQDGIGLLINLPYMTNRRTDEDDLLTRTKGVSRDCVGLKRKYSGVYLIHGRQASIGHVCRTTAVSYDGTWQKRGHTSKHGLGVVIEVTTGLAVDYHVMSSFCQPCSTKGVTMKKKGEAAYNEWWEQHKVSCTINHTGSAGMMEVEAAKLMFFLLPRPRPALHNACC
ncbi:hypothetical protein RRG08_028140 [Elysia crispata]|uniref:Mutator-like transposase domain-containing protein n=1 Tax=Elysia crispata TaxID=231223 RepID=A0AAE1D744_9GAST|nr:hypothetical protein RRG08_028140 [Elysia crispata]